MKYYYLAIMYRPTQQLMVVLKCHNKHLPMDVLETYAKWGDWDMNDIYGNVTRCADYNDVLAGKDMLTNVS